MKAMNTTTGSEIAHTVVETKSMLSRMKGLLGRDLLPNGEGLLIKPCMGIHTFGMSFPIDVVFLNKENRVVAVNQNMSPNRMSRIYFSAASVLELPSGHIELSETAPGDLIAFS